MNRPLDTDSCPCGSGKTFGDCCGAVLAGRKKAATAEELMRARFTAHAIGDYEFLHRSYRGTAGQPYVAIAEGAETEWTRLVVHKHTPGPTPDISHVDFSAYGKEKDGEVVLHEKAEFVRQNGEWIYTRPLREGPAPYQAGAPKPGRNEPCSCGSGKKYKNCCGR